MGPKLFASLGLVTLLFLTSPGYAAQEKKINVEVSILFQDTDGDGLSDGMEQDVYKTDPGNPDSDGDGYSDGAEVMYEGDPLQPGIIPSKGDLHVTSDPPGAAVFLNGEWGYLGRFQGVTEADKSILIPKVKVGRHLLRLSQPGYEDSYDTVQVVPPANIDWKTGLGIEFSDASINMKALTTPDYGPGGPLTILGGPINVGNAAVPVVCDWDNDGRKDLLVGNGEGLLLLYRNIGSDFSPLFSEGLPIFSNMDNLNSSDNFLAPFVVDWDNDGKKDLLIGTLEGNVLFFKNIGGDDTPSFAGGEILVTLSGGYARPVVVDWDGDRKKDLIAGDGKGEVRLLLNRGPDDKPELSDPQSSTTLLSLGQLERVSPFVVTDWDGDGRKDIIAGTPDGLILLYSNQGADQEGREIFSGPVPIKAGTTGAKADIVAGQYASPFVADWNGDGVKDLIVGNNNGNILYYGDRPPVASIFIVSDEGPSEGGQVSFNGGLSSDPDGDPLTYYWDFGDGSPPLEGGAEVLHTFVNDGEYTVTLTVTDPYGMSNSAKGKIVVANEAPLVTAGADQWVVAGDLVYFTGESMDPGTEDTYSVLWDFGDGSTGTGGLMTSHRFDNPGEYSITRTVTLTVTDDAGASRSDQITVRVDPPGAIRPFSLTYPFNGMVFSTPSVDVRGILNIPPGGTAVEVNSAPAFISEEGAFSGEVPLLPGINTIIITLTDQVGYVSTERFTVTRSGGDINDDGVVDIADAFRVLQVSSGQETPESLGLNRDIMDVSPLRKDEAGNLMKNPDGSVILAPDGVINVADALILLRAALGYIILPLPH
ncbi:MAG: PKD domain-containing protein [Nitrospirae bacterium]|nr:PKD domain-containing protein [Nitrospirota bacterium]